MPGDAPTIQAAVDQAAPGDMVLIAPGIYRESVFVATDRIVIRGLDRNRVILDGELAKDDGILVTSDGVAVENMTIRRYLNNGLIFNGVLTRDGTFDENRPPVNGWRGSYITVHNNGLYGVYAFASQNGEFDHIYASGHADSGIYIGQCVECNAVVSNSVMDSNTIGYEGTNSSDDIYIVTSVMRENRIGITSNSGRRERFSPSRAVTIAANLITNNNNAQTPPTEGGFGIGIALGGSERVRVLNNRVTGNRAAGIVVTDQEGSLPSGNQVERNVLTRNGIDLVYAESGGGSLATAKNCFRRNTFSTSFPESIETQLRCDADATRQVGGRWPAVAQPPGIAFERVPAPGPQPSMPDTSTPPAPAVGLPRSVDLAGLRTPEDR